MLATLDQYQDRGCYRTLLQQTFAYTASSYSKLGQDKGSSSSQAVPQKEGGVLFRNDELKEKKENCKLMTAPHKGLRGLYSFRTFSPLIRTGGQVVRVKDPIPTVPLMERSPIVGLVGAVTHDHAGQCVPKRIEKKQRCAAVWWIILAVCRFVPKMITAIPWWHTHTRDEKCWHSIQGAWEVIGIADFFCPAESPPRRLRKRWHCRFSRNTGKLAPRPSTRLPLFQRHSSPGL